MLIRRALTMGLVIFIFYFILLKINPEFETPGISLSACV
jgi:hypothetical protein